MSEKEDKSGGRDEISELEDHLIEESQRLARLYRERDPVPVEDHALHRSAGPVRLSECFEGKRDLIVVHNMGTGCRYCTMWADGLTGLQHHLRDRAGLVLVSPDPAETLENFAAGRGWNFPLASAHGTGFLAAVGMEAEGGGSYPGMTTYHRDGDGGISLIAREHFGPFDLFCPTWHFLARLKEGVNDWEPQYDYE